MFQQRGLGADSTQHCRGGTKNFPIVTSLNIVRSLKNFSVPKRYSKVDVSRLSWLVKPIHWVKSSAQWYVFQRMNSWCQLWQVGKVWWEWYVFQRMKIVQICLLNEWILIDFLESLFHEIDFLTWFLVYFKLDFYCQDRNRQKIKFSNQFCEIRDF